MSCAECDRSTKLHSIESQNQFMSHTLKLFPAFVSPLAYPEGHMPECIKAWYAKHWEGATSDERVFEEGVKLMRWFANPFIDSDIPIVKPTKENYKPATAKNRES